MTNGVIGSSASQLPSPRTATLTATSKWKPERRTRKQNITWFTPLTTTLSVLTWENAVFHLLKKHFPPWHRLHKIIAIIKGLHSNNKGKNYFGLCKTEFKARCYNPMPFFKHRPKSNATKLSKYVWSWRDAGKEPNITWALLATRSHTTKGPNNEVCLTKNTSSSLKTPAPHKRNEISLSTSDATKANINKKM